MNSKPFSITVTSSVLRAFLATAGGDGVFVNTAHGNGPKINSADYNRVQVDSGGFTYSSGGGYACASTASQPDAGVLAGEGYTLDGGFWRGGTVVGNTYRVYLPLVLRQAP